MTMFYKKFRKEESFHEDGYGTGVFLRQHGINLPEASNVAAKGAYEAVISDLCHQISNRRYLGGGLSLSAYTGKFVKANLLAFNLDTYFWEENPHEVRIGVWDSEALEALKDNLFLFPPELAVKIILTAYWVENPELERGRDAEEQLYLLDRMSVAFEMTVAYKYLCKHCLRRYGEWRDEWVWWDVKEQLFKATQ